MIELLARGRCSGTCERYVPNPDIADGIDAAPDTLRAYLAFDVTSVHDEAQERGWTIYPLMCPDCAADLRKKITRDQVRNDGDAP